MDDKSRAISSLSGPDDPEPDDPDGVIVPRLPTPKMLAAAVKAGVTEETAFAIFNAMLTVADEDRVTDRFESRADGVFLV